MTLCIAANCLDTNERVVVISFDRRIEAGGAGGDIGFKFRQLSPRWCALMAGEVGLAWEVLEKYQKLLLKVGNKLSSGDAPQKLREPLNEIRKVFADRHVRKTLAITLKELLAGTHSLPEATLAQTWYEIPQQIPRDDQLQLLLIGWIENNFHIFKVRGIDLERVEPFAAIGSGAHIAEPALFQRQLLSLSQVNETAYAVFEAQNLGSIAPGVGKHSELAVLYFSEQKQDICWRVLQYEMWPFMYDLYSRFGLHPIEPIEFPNNAFKVYEIGRLPEQAEEQGSE